MLIELFKMIHATLGTLALITGGVVLYKILCAETLDRWSIHFLQSSLLASISGLLLSRTYIGFTQWIAMLGVYVSGMAVLAIRKYYLRDLWALVFALSLTLSFFLDLFIAVEHLHRLAMAFPSLLHNPEQTAYYAWIAELSVILIFVGIVLFVAKKHIRRPFDLSKMYR
jgi:hypothetical protein